MSLRSWSLPSLLVLSLTGACSDDGGGDTQDANMAEGASDERDGAAGGDLGKGDGHDVIAIGDSWMNLNGSAGIQFSLKMASGQNYRTYGVPGTRLLNEVIPMQYEAAKAENADIKTVVMTGGGNDILQDIAVLPSCSDANIDTMPACKARIDEVAARLVTLWEEMASDGVRDVIVVGYSHKARILGPLGKSVDYSAQKIQPLCEAVPKPLRCHAVDSDMEVPDLMLRSDGIHPDDASYQALGAKLYALMESEGMRR